MNWYKVSIVNSKTQEHTYLHFMKYYYTFKYLSYRVILQLKHTIKRCNFIENVYIRLIFFKVDICRKTVLKINYKVFRAINPWLILKRSLFCKFYFATMLYWGKIRIFGWPISYDTKLFLRKRKLWIMKNFCVVLSINQ